MTVTRPKSQCLKIILSENCDYYMGIKRFLFQLQSMYCSDNSWFYKILFHVVLHILQLIKITILLPTEKQTHANKFKSQHPSTPPKAHCIDTDTMDGWTDRRRRVENCT